MQEKDPQNLEIAIEWFHEALKRKSDKNEAYIHFYLGNAYFYSHNFQKAEEEYKKAKEEEFAKGKRYFMEAYNNLGLIALDRNNPEEALNYFTVAYKNTCLKQMQSNNQENAINPGCFHLIFNLASVYLDAGDYDQAIELYHKAIENFQSSSGVVSNDLLVKANDLLASTYSQEGNYDQAIKYYHESIEASKNQVNNASANVLIRSYNLIGYTYIELAKEEKNDEHYMTALQYLNSVTELLKKESSLINPDFLISEKGLLNRNLGRVYLGLKNWELALEHLREAEKEVSKHPSVHLLLAELYNHRCDKGDSGNSVDAKQRYLELMDSEGKLLEAIDKLNELQQQYPCTQ
jgi:tetratricopeptide (TPR) repeat protein